MRDEIMVVVLLGLLLVGVAAQRCVFCDNGLSYDLSTLPTETFILHSDLPDYPYFVSRPCGSVTTDMCIAGPTSDPIARHVTVDPDGVNAYGRCEGLGTLNATYKPVEVLSHGDAGLTITLHSVGSKKTNFNIECDSRAPMDNPPKITVYTTGSEIFNVSWRHPAACHPTQHSGGCTATAPPAPPPPACDACLPRWQPTWNMSRSTILYGCNATGPHNIAEATAYGIMVYDWSHEKLQWVNSHPMNDDARLLSQAEAVLAADPSVPGEQPRVWVYRNKIKALNWIGQVREKLDDPQYAGWFVRFKDYQGRASNNSYHAPACDWYGDAKSGPPKCSGFYHDQGQSPTRRDAGPAYCRAATDNHNVCVDQCDCGATNPCGEYTFDHRNASFAEWWVNEWMISNQTLLHDPPIGLGWLDDAIGFTGVSELKVPPGSWVNDTGSSLSDMQAHVDAFLANIGRLQRAVVDHKGFYWQMIQGTGPAIRPVANIHDCHKPKSRHLSPAQCAATLRQWCVPDPEPWQIAHLYFVCADEMVNATIARDATAEFLLTRGDYAWIGYNWNGCIPQPLKNATWLRPRPVQWDVNYGGRPVGPCEETAPASGVFKRTYPNAEVEWDCNTGTGAIRML